jgi:DNA-directed RNA polymerase subunit RPC12/RpoP
MAFVEGGAFKCSVHDFETESVAEWNKHGEQYPDIHYESGATACTKCGTNIEFDKLPFQPIDVNTGSKNINLRCDDCESKTMGSVSKRTSIKQVSDKELR